MDDDNITEMSNDGDLPLSENTMRKLRDTAVVVILVVCLIVGKFGYQYFNEKSAQKASTTLKTEADKIAFVDKYPNVPIAGIVALSLADEYIAKGDNAKASEFYETAQKSLKNTLLLDRAKISWAIANGYSTAPDKFKSVMNSIIRDRRRMINFREVAACIFAEAMQSSGTEKDKLELETLLKDMPKLGFKEYDVLLVKAYVGMKDEPAPMDAKS